MEKPGVNVIDAAARGAGDGLHLALNIGAMLIAFLALIAMVNGILGWLHCVPFGLGAGSMQQILGVVVRAGRVAAGRELEGLRHHRQSARHAAGAE